MSRESKAELTDRLRREGRFDEFKKRREELKAEGIPANEAWYQAAVEFPAANGNGANGKAPNVDVSALKGKPPAPIVEAAAWVFENLDCEWVTPGEAPSAGAWSLLQWARSSMAARGEFYRTFAAKVVVPPEKEARQAEEESRQKRQKADAKWQDTIDQLLNQKQSHDSVERERAAVN